MPYITRDKLGRIIGSFAVKQFEGQEFSEAEVELWKPYQQRREIAYVAEADKLFLLEQAGEIPAGTWAAKRLEIKSRIPKD